MDNFTSLLNDYLELDTKDKVALGASLIFDAGCVLAAFGITKRFLDDTFEPITFFQKAAVVGLSLSVAKNADMDISGMVLSGLERRAMENGGDSVTGEDGDDTIIDASDAFE